MQDIFITLQSCKYSLKFHHIQKVIFAEQWVNRVQSNTTKYIHLFSCWLYGPSCSTVRKKTNKFSRSSGFLLIRSNFFYPDMFRHMVAILRGSWVPDKLLKQCAVLWACADYDPSHVASCRGHSIFIYFVVHLPISWNQPTTTTAPNSHQFCVSVVPPDDGQVMPETCRDFEHQ
jgi:hypothetical protein